MKKEVPTANLEDWLANLELHVLLLLSVLVVLVAVGSVLLALARPHSAVRANIGTGLEERVGLINWTEDVESSRGLHHDWSDRDRLSDSSSTVTILDLTQLEVEMTNSCSGDSDDSESPPSVQWSDSAESEYPPFVQRVAPELTDSGPGDSACSEFPPSVELAGSAMQWVAPGHWHYASAPESPPFARSGRLTARRSTLEPTDVVISMIASAPELTDFGPGDSACSEFLLSVELACLPAPQWVAPEDWH